VVILLYESGIWSWRSIGKRQVNPQTSKQLDRVLAGRRARHDKSAVAGVRGIGSSLGCAPMRWTVVGPLIWEIASIVIGCVSVST